MGIFHKKYTPTSLDDIVFKSPAVKQQLVNVIKPQPNKIILLVGDNGVGKGCVSKVLLDEYFKFTSNKDLLSKCIYCDPTDSSDDYFFKYGISNLKKRPKYLGIIFDRIDYLNKATQSAMLQEFTPSKNNFVVATASNAKGIEPSLLAMCEIVKLERPRTDDWLPRLKEVTKAELGFSPDSEWLRNMAILGENKGRQILFKIEGLIAQSK